ncbi:MAG: cardiolipin synthase [Oscillospiraceae bacterium]|nr:cardiolipin synthase [Oscillospiraceae bacterium]
MTLKKLLSFIFHRTTLVAVLLLLQVAVLIVNMAYFSAYFVYFYWFCVVVSALVVIWIVSNHSDPGYKIAWIIPILLFPLFGGTVYLLVCGNRMPPKTQEKMQGIVRQMAETLDRDNKAEELAIFDADAVNQSRYLERYALCPAYTNTATRYFPLGDVLFPRMLAELRKAERYIFLEYFIIERGIFWNSVLEILTEKAAAGLDVRVLYDDVGSLYTLPKDYAQELEARGIRCAVFNRFIPILSVRLNNRDHRKFCIIDGHTAFTGGINLADEYINRVVKFGHWKDSAILLQGEAVWSMVVMFLTMWNYVKGQEEPFDHFRPDRLPEEAAGGRGYFVQPYTDSPLDGEPVGGTVYLNLINKAKRYVYLTTPYLIISDSVNTALCNAAKSGVDVRIMTPHIPDKRIIFEVTRAHYEPLLAAGVKIYEYTPGFVHAKNFAVDDIYGTVGSVNMDYRSMFLHFEAGVWLCHDPSILDIKADFLLTLERCQQVTLERCREHSLLRHFLRAILRVFAPLM